MLINRKILTVIKHQLKISFKKLKLSQKIGSPEKGCLKIEKRQSSFGKTDWNCCCGYILKGFLNKDE